MYFLGTHRNLGTIKPNSTHVITYKASNDIPDIKSISASCGCSQPSFDRDNLLMNVVFKAGPLPVHLQGKEQKFRKSITITYENGEVDTLTFSGTKK